MMRCVKPFGTVVVAILSPVSRLSWRRTNIVSQIRWHRPCTAARPEVKMAPVASLREHLVEELNDALDAEQQLTEALPDMAERASRRELKAAFRAHLAETKRHVQRATQALQMLGEKATGKTCEAMKGLLEEGQEL